MCNKNVYIQFDTHKVASTTNKLFVGVAPTTNKLFVGVAPTTNKLFVGAAPTNNFFLTIYKTFQGIVYAMYVIQVFPPV